MNSFPAGAALLLMAGAAAPWALGACRAPTPEELSALVFALMHDAYRMPFTFAVGLALGALRLRAGSLLPSLLAHATLNSLTFAAAPFLDDPAKPLPDPRPLLGLALLVLGTATTAFVWNRLPPSLPAVGTPEDLPARLRA